MGERVTFSYAHTRCAADLMADASHQLLAISKEVDGELEWWMRFMARPQRRADDRDERYVRALEAARADDPALIAGAAYSQWISDHLNYLIVIWHTSDARCAENYMADRPDELTCHRLQTQLWLASQDTGEPSFDAPPFPVALDNFPSASFYRRRLDHVRDTFADAAAEIARSSTPSTRALRAQVDRLTEWAKPKPPGPDEHSTSFVAVALEATSDQHRSEPLDVIISNGLPIDFSEVLADRRPTDPELVEAWAGSGGHGSVLVQAMHTWEAARHVGAAAARRGLTEGWSRAAAAYFMAGMTSEERADAELAATRVEIPEFLHEKTRAWEEMGSLFRHWGQLEGWVRRQLHYFYREKRLLYADAVSRGDMAGAKTLIAGYWALADYLVKEAMVNVEKWVK